MAVTVFSERFITALCKTQPSVHVYSLLKSYTSMQYIKRHKKLGMYIGKNQVILYGSQYGGQYDISQCYE